MDGRNDKLVAVAGSLGVHVLVLLVLYIGLLQHTELPVVAAEGPAMEASLVSAPQQAVAAIRQVHSEPQPVPVVTPQPQPEPKPQDAPQPQQPVPQVRLPRSEPVDQDEVRRTGELAALKQQKEQEAKHQQKQVDLSAKQAQDEAENRQRLLDQNAKDQAETRRKIMLLSQKQQQTQNLQAKNAAASDAVAAPATPAPPPAGNNANASDLTDVYRNLVRLAVHQNWRPQDVVPSGVHCHARYTLLSDGVYARVNDITFLDCPYDATARASVTDALNNSQLPYKGYEGVFYKVKEGTIDMCDPEEACK